MSVATPEQLERRQRALYAKELLSNDYLRDVYRLTEHRALKALRAAKTPDEAWEARALLVGHDEFLGVLLLLSRDEALVAHEIDQAQAREEGAKATEAQAIALEEYRRKAIEARAEAHAEGLPGA